MGLPGAEIKWDERRENMKDVCSACHSEAFIDGFYVQYDGLIHLYNTKFAIPGLALYNAAKPLFKRQVKFANEIDFVWFEIWHHEGRRARHGASMQGPDYTHWHGTYEVGKHFYTEYVPLLEELIEANIDSKDAERKKTAENLKTLLEQVLNDEFVVDKESGEKSTGHKWFIGKMSAEEAAERKQEISNFKKRYGNNQ
jgi:ribosomal protein L31